VSSLEEAVGAALKNGEPGDVILFSPAFASFGMFKNEYDRGDRFVAAVRSVLDAH
jgi:UDP-N-acetylmuramoylalanine--D-glutamate ligase